MKFGIVGLSLSHPYAFADILTKKGHEIGYVWDNDKDNCKAFSEKYNSIIAEGYEEVSTKDVDGVFIESESYLHCSIAKAFIKKGIPVFIDKVMALNIDELQKTLELAKENNTIIMSCSSIRYKPEYIKLREEITSGMLGKVIGISADIRHDMEGYLKPPHTWQDNPKTSGGEIMNFGVHGVEPVYSILGPGVKWVRCFRDRLVYNNARSEDVAYINIKFNNGSTGTVSLISCINDYGFSMKVYGTKGLLEAGDKSIPSTNEDAYYQYGYEKMISEFIAGIEKDVLPIPYNEIEEVVKVLIASRISADENRVVYIEDLTK